MHIIREQRVAVDDEEKFSRGEKRMRRKRAMCSESGSNIRMRECPDFTQWLRDEKSQALLKI